MQAIDIHNHFFPRSWPDFAQRFGTPVLYRYVRHPLYVGWLVAFWATPTMTAAHLVFALATTVYILIAIRFEDRKIWKNLPDRCVQGASFRRSQAGS